MTICESLRDFMRMFETIAEIVAIISILLVVKPDCLPDLVNHYLPLKGRICEKM